MPESNIIKIDGVTLNGGTPIHLCVQQGGHVVITGAPGSGKTTLLKIMNGLVEPGTGNVMLFNRDINSLSQSALLRVRQQISYLGFPRGLLEKLDRISEPGPAFEISLADG